MTLTYLMHEATHAMFAPARAYSEATRLFFKNPANPMSWTTAGKQLAAACDLFERTTRRYGKPSFDLPTTLVGGERVAVQEAVVWERPFCRLIHFQRALKRNVAHHPKVLMVAPMSGHYATLLRGTVEAFLPSHEVYITDWTSARMVPIAEGPFEFDDYVDYIISMLHLLGPDTHVMAVCQPSVPVLAAIARMEAEGDLNAPRSMTLMGGPIDTRVNPTEVNKLAEARGTEWFKRNCVVRVPMTYPGMMRAVYPGFFQLSGFMAMNMDKHVNAHYEYYRHLIKGDGDSTDKHREFYDEYLAVMDLDADFYLQTVDRVFVKHELPKGEMMHRGKPVDLKAVRNVALMTVEGEFDDISGLGQTQAAQTLCSNIPQDKRVHYVQKGVGHYGVFNGSRFRAEIGPRIMDFMSSLDQEARRAAASPKRTRLTAIAGGIAAE